MHVAAHHRAPLRVDARLDLDRLTTLAQEGLALVLAAAAEARTTEAIGVEHEHAHAHAQARELIPDRLLGLDRATAHAVVLERAEALVVHEAQLIEEVVPAVMAEHAEVRGVVELEAPVAGRWILARGSTGGSRARRGAGVGEAGDGQAASEEQTATIDGLLTHGARVRGESGTRE